jgi:hypothetical protein
MAANSGQITGSIERHIHSFEEMADLPAFEDKRKALLRKLDKAFTLAEDGRTYTDKKGETHYNPDSGGMVKCVELAARLLGVLAEAEKRIKDGEGDTRTADIEQVASLLRSVGYKVEKAA